MNLHGIRIVSFNHFLMGPYGIQFLADAGAEVIAIEPVAGGFQRQWGGLDRQKAGGETFLQLVAGRNKKSIALNLKDPEAIKIAKELIKSADVVAENFRPGVMEKLGLGYEALKEIKPDLIYAAATGYGVDGPYIDKPGQDMLAQCLSGLAWINGKAGEVPRLIGVSAIDHHGGVIFAAAILTALVSKLKTGKGSRVDVNLLSAALDLQAESLVSYLNSDKSTPTHHPAHSGSWYHEAPYGVYRTSDTFIAVSLNQLSATFDALEIPESERFMQLHAFERREEISQLVAKYLATNTFAHWAERFDERKLWYSPVSSYDDVVRDPQIQHNGDLVEVEAWTGEKITLLAHPVRYDGQQAQIQLAPQKLGAQTSDVLMGIGYTCEQITELADRGAIGTA